MKPLEYPHLKYAEMYRAQNKKRRCDIKVNIAAKREEKSWHSISQEEDVGGMCCRFCYWRCTPGERSETDWHHLFPVNCFLDPPSFFRYRKKQNKTVSRARKHFERETEKNFRLFFSPGQWVLVYWETICQSLHITWCGLYSHIF